MKRGKKKRPVASSTVPPQPSEAERAAIERAKMNGSARHPRVSLGLTVEGPNKATAQSPHTDHQGWIARLEDAFGTSSRAFVDVEVSRIINALRVNGVVDPLEIDAIFAVLDGQKPRDEVEAMLISNIAITHSLIMKTAGNLNRSNTIQQQDSNALALSRLQRTFLLQVEALAKYRRGGEQKVRVEHVHVYPGGQAIVGQVTNAPGAGTALERSNRPHANTDPTALALSECTALPRPDSQREAVPVACHSEGKMPNARRSKAVGRTGGRA